MGGDFFKSVPSEGDAYILKYIIHDWEDARALEILRNCQEAMAEGGRLLLIEALIPSAEGGQYAELSDLEMLVFLGSQERTREEYESLLRKAGFRLHRTIPTSSGLSIPEAIRE